MLRELSIRNVVLVDRLDLRFERGLGVLTGETGAGKSILLDALGLALGFRAEARLVRAGADRAEVTAVFDAPDDGPLKALLREQDLDADEDLILRRGLSRDGRSKAFVNDRPVSVSLLRQLGEQLVEIHGQQETSRLLDPNAHRRMVDLFGDHGTAVDAVRDSYRKWRDCAAQLAEQRELLEQVRRDEDYLRHVVEELALLDPQPGEEETLAEQRTLLMQGEQIMESLSAAQTCLSSPTNDLAAGLRQAQRHLERVAQRLEGRVDDAMAALDRAGDALAEASQEVERIQADLDLDPRRLEQVEERLFALRGAARKHQVSVDDLPRTREALAERLAGLEAGERDLAALEQAERENRHAFEQAAESLGARRRATIQGLDQAVGGEFAPLHLERARFVTEITPLPRERWNEFGGERVEFRVATNPGAAPGPIGKIASGGELARFMLALKVVLAQADSVPTLIFDEVDAGVGGAVAAAVGERLARLGRDVQVLVVTHSPQVAAQGSHHWRIKKTTQADQATTQVSPLAAEERQEEIARMLAGNTITDAARAAASSLLQGAGNDG